jgi:hypothetical protein
MAAPAVLSDTAIDAALAPNATAVVTQPDAPEASARAAPSCRAFKPLGAKSLDI